MERWEPYFERVRSLRPELRLQWLLGHAKNFPSLPEELTEARDAGLNRVEECQTPLFLWVAVRNGVVTLHADAPRDAPTVRGFLGFLMEVLNGASAEEVAQIPLDLLDRMGLGEVLGILRTQGLGSVIRRIRAAARAPSPAER